MVATAGKCSWQLALAGLGGWEEEEASEQGFEHSDLFFFKGDASAASLD